MMNMKLLSVVTPPSIYQEETAMAAATEEDWG